MKRFVLSLSIALAAVACVSPKVKTSEVRDVVEAVVLRHDAYVMEDAELTGGESSVALQQSSELLGALGEKKVEQARFNVLVSPVAARHDAYILADLQLSDFERKVYLRSTTVLREVAEAD